MTNIQDLINEAVREKREDKEITSWHISRLGSCLRGIYFERLGVKPDSEFDDRTLRVFDMGNKIEDWIVDLIKGKAEIDTQIRVEGPELGVTGYIDLMIGDYVYEIKSKHSKSFWYMEKGGKPMRQHQYQLWTYLYLLDKPVGSIVYVSKDDLSIAEYVVRKDNKSIENEVMEELRLLNLAWQEKNPALLPLYDKKDWRSRYCRWHSKCEAIDK